MEFRPLSGDETAALESGLALAARLVNGKHPLSVDQVQELYDTMARREPSFVEGEIATGLAFGELIVGATGYEWVRLSDEYGEETVLAPRGKRINCAPISIIRKRIGRREEVDIAALRDGIIETVRARLDSADIGNR